MEHYGDLEEKIMLENWDKIIQQNIHHQFKYLVLHGLLLVLDIIFQELLKLMEHYGHGEVFIKDHLVQV